MNYDHFSEFLVIQLIKKEFKKQKTSSVEWFDVDKVKLPLIIRSRKAGDRFVPLGLREEKKVGKFLTAAKVPRQIRKKVGEPPPFY